MDFLDLIKTKQKTMNNFFFLNPNKKSDFFFLQNHELERNSQNLGLKQNHEKAGITNWVIKKCRDPGIQGSPVTEI